MSAVQATSDGAGAAQTRETEQLKKLLFKSESARLRLLQRARVGHADQTGSVGVARIGARSRCERVTGTLVFRGEMRH